MEGGSRARAQGGFGLTMTCAAHVQAVGKGFSGQLGIWSDDHIPGLRRLTGAIKAEQSIAIAQLHHAGMRSPADLIGCAPVQMPVTRAYLKSEGISEKFQAYIQPRWPEFFAD